MTPISPALVPDRDGAFKRPRYNEGGTIYYSVPGAALITASTRTVAANTDYYAPIYVASPIIIDQLADEVQTGAGTNHRIGLYRADLDWQPMGAPLVDSGNLDSATPAVKTYTPGTPVVLGRGQYVSVLNADGAVVFRCLRQGHESAINTAFGSTAFQSGWRVARTYAAFPTPGTVSNASTNGANPVDHMIVFRVSKP